MTLVDRRPGGRGDSGFAYETGDGETRSRPQADLSPAAVAVGMRRSR